MRNALLMLLVALAGTARADNPGAVDASPVSHAYSLQVFKVKVAPTKSDGRVWDGTTVLRDLPDPKGLGTVAFAAAIEKKLVEAGLNATAAPDIYVVVEVGGKKLQTSVKQDTFTATWDSDEQQLTVSAHPGDYLKVSVYDKDLQENTKDLIGAVLYKLTADDLANGVVEIRGFDQVLLLQLTLQPVATKELLYPPGRYLVTILSASISPVKPAGVVNAGKSWDVFGGLPDTFGTASIGGVSIPLPKVQDSLRPEWNAATEVDLDESSSVSVTLTDKDFTDKSDDPIGTVSSAQLLAEAPRRDGMIHLTDHAAILDLAIKLVPVAKPLSADECRVFFDHVVTIAQAEGQGNKVESLKNPTTAVLRGCVAKITRKQFGCVMAATDTAGLKPCM